MASNIRSCFLTSFVSTTCLSLTSIVCLFFTLSSFLVSCLDSPFCRVKLFSLCILIFGHGESIGIDQPTCFDMTHKFPVSNISTVFSFFLFPLCKLHTAEHSPTTSGFLIQPHSLTDYISFLALSTSFGLAYIVWLFGIIGPLFGLYTWTGEATCAREQVRAT